MAESSLSSSTPPLPESLPSFAQVKAWLTNYYPSLIGALILVVVGMIVIHFVSKLLAKGLAKSRIDTTMHRFIRSTVKIVLYTLLLLLAASALNINITPLVTAFGAVGLALSLALKDTLANLASGIVILYNRPFKHGDFVEVNGLQGTVIEISYTYTKLKTIDNKVVFIPNSKVSAADIINFSSEETRRLDLYFAIGYSDDFKLVQRLILDIIEHNELALKNPEPLVRVCGHGDSGVKIACYVWVKRENYLALSYDLYEQVKAAFDRNGISIPYRQLDVTIKNSNPS